MEQIGKTITCDRCGKNTFLKKLNNKILDGGFTSCECYEDLPDGWGKVNNRNVCPECNELYHETFLKFWLNENPSR